MARCGWGHLSLPHRGSGLGMLVAAAILLLAQLPPGVIAGKSTKSAQPSRHKPIPKNSGHDEHADNFRLYGAPPTWSPPDPDAAPTPKSAKTGKSGRPAGSSKAAKSALPPPSHDPHANTKTPKSTGKSMGMGMGKSGHVHTAKSAEPSGQPTARPTANPTDHPTARPTPTADEVLAAMGWGDLTTRAPRTPDVVVVVAETETETERPAVAPGPVVNAHPANTSDSMGAGAEGINGAGDTDRTVDDIDAELASGGGGGDRNGDSLQATSEGGALRGVGSQTMIWAGAAFGVALVGVLLLGIRRVVGRHHTAGVGKGGAAAAKKEKKSAPATSKAKAKAAAVSTARTLPDAPAAAANYTVASMPDGPDYPARTSPTVASLDVDYAEPDVPEDPEHEMWCVPRHQLDYRSQQDDVDAALGMGRAIAATEEPLYMEPEPIDGGMYDGNRSLMIRNASNKDHGGTESPDGEDQWHC